MNDMSYESDSGSRLISSGSRLTIHDSRLRWAGGDAPPYGQLPTNHALRSAIKMGGRGRSALPNAYTLLEILMVISIMALLMTITMPAFTDMMKGQGVESAARNICQRLKLARSYAISNREYVAVLIPQSAKNGAAYPASGIPTKYYDRSYRACLVTKPSSGNYVFKRWILGEVWSFLPTGTAFFETDDDKNVALLGTPPLPTNGTCTLIDNVDFSDLDGGSANINNVAAILFKPTGRSGGLRYINIGEGTVNGSTLVVTNPDVAAVVTVMVDQFTGRVSYGDN